MYTRHTHLSAFTFQGVVRGGWRTCGEFDSENVAPILRGTPQLRGFSRFFLSSQKPRKMGVVLYIHLGRRQTT